VQRRVMARHNGCAAGGAGRRHGVMTFERDARIAQIGRLMIKNF
jgi:hypothetical protein